MTISAIDALSSGLSLLGADGLMNGGCGCSCDEPGLACGGKGICAGCLAVRVVEDDDVEFMEAGQ